MWGILTKTMETAIDVLKPFGALKKFKGGTFLFQAGEKAVGFYYVLRGEVRVFQSDAHAKEVEVARLGSGNFLAEVGLFSFERYPASAEVTAPDTQLLYFDKKNILYEIERNPALAKCLIKLFSDKCAYLTQKLRALSFQGVRERLIEYLLSQCPQDSAKASFELGIRKTDLARRLGTVSETLSRTFAKLSKERLIQVNGSRVRLLDTNRLHDEIAKAVF